MQFARHAVLLGSAFARASGVAAWLTVASSLGSAQEQATPPASAESPAAVQVEAAQPSTAIPAEPAPSAPEAAVSARPAAAPVQTEATCPVCEDEGGVEGAGAFLVGFGFFDLSSLNDRLVAAGYERIAQPMILIGGKGHAIFENGFVLGGMGGGIIGPSGGGPGELSTQFGGGFGMADFGFAFVHTQAVSLIATGGFGGYGYSLAINDPGSTSFDAALENPRRGTTLSRGGLLFGLSVAFEGKVPLGQPKRGRQGFFAVGVRAGGLYGPPLGHWSLSDGSELTEAPDDPMAGFYAALTLGFGGSRATP
jgi:hypothetical protein